MRLTERQRHTHYFTRSGKPLHFAPDDLEDAEVEQAVNLANPTRLAHGWHLSSDATFHSGEPMPCVCEQDATRKHYLMVC